MTAPRFCDLHTHSTASDGTDTPAELAARAKDAGLSAIALTDHDTTAGHAECRAACERLGVEFVPGVELSADADSLLGELGLKHQGQLHILGLVIDAQNTDLQSLCAELVAGREERVPRMLAALGSLGVSITMEEVRGIAGNAVLCRPHVARAMVARGYVASKQEAFDRFIGVGRPAYVHKNDGPAARCIDVIHEAGGVAVLAHPIHLRCPTLEDLRRVLAHLRNLELDGLEAMHSDQPPEFASAMKDIAEELGLSVSGGSDYHGTVKPVELGSQQVPFVTLDRLRAGPPTHRRAGPASRRPTWSGWSV